MHRPYLRTKRAEQSIHRRRAVRNVFLFICADRNCSVGCYHDRKCNLFDRAFETHDDGQRFFQIPLDILGHIIANLEYNERYVTPFGFGRRGFIAS